MSLLTNFALIKRVPFFRDADERCVRDIISVLQAPQSILSRPAAVSCVTSRRTANLLAKTLPETSRRNLSAKPLGEISYCVLLYIIPPRTTRFRHFHMFSHFVLILAFRSHDVIYVSLRTDGTVRPGRGDYHRGRHGGGDVLYQKGAVPDLHCPDKRNAT